MRNIIIAMILVVGLIGTFNELFSQTLGAYKNLATGSVEIEGKKYVLQKGEIQVPEDRDKPASRILKLPIRIVKSKNPKPDEPVFWLDGGPGVSNISRSPAYVCSTELLENHDVVFVGYRGVDGSTILSSKKVNKAFKGLHHKMLSDESLDNIAAKIKDYIAELDNKEIDINRYTMLDVIDDLEDARSALGYEKINLLTVSYGTRVALLYSYKHPEVLKRTVMIGPNPPGHFVWQPEKTDQILDLYDSLYKEQSGSDYKGSIKETMKKAFEKMPRRWSVYRLDADKIKIGTFGALYSKETAALAFEAYFNAVNMGDYSLVYLIQLFGGGITNAVGELLAKGFSADFQPGMDYRKKVRASNTVLGGNISLLFWGITNESLITMIPEEYRKCRMSSSETLIISGDLDVSTPSDYATTELMPFLSNGHHIVLKNLSHADIAKKARMTKSFLSTYFDSGVVEKSLMNSTEAIDFKPKTKFGKVKIFVAGLIL